MYYNTKEIKKSIKSLQNNLIELSKNKENKQKTYMSNIDIIDKNGEVKKLSYDFVKTSKDYYQNIVMRTKYLQNLNVLKEEKHIGFFITLTLPTEYHPYTTIILNKGTEQEREEKVYNDKYNEELSINQGYKKLNEMFRKIQKDLYDTENTKKITLDFIKVIEYHKSMIPHLHGVVFVPERLVKLFKQHIENVFGNIELKKIKNDITNKIKYLKNENIGRSEVEQINNIERVVPYLLKYIKKSLNPINEEDFHLLNGWKKKNKIRIFTISNVSIPRFIFKKLYGTFGNLIDKTKEDYNMLEEIEKISNIEVNYFNSDISDKCIKTKEYGSDNGRYKVIVDIDKIDCITYINNFTNYKKSFKKRDFNLSLIIEDKEYFEDNRFDLLEDYEEFEIKKYLDYIKNKTQYNDNETHLKNMSNWCERLGIVETDKRIDNNSFSMYKIVNFLIIDSETNKIIYDKNDFKYINNN